MPGADTRRVAATGATPLDAYLTRLGAALAALPSAERREILLETRSHVVEQARRAPHRPVEAVLAELGAPEAYARQFLPERAPGVGPGDAAADAGAGGSGHGAPPSGIGRISSVTLLGLSRLLDGGVLRLLLLAVVLAAYGVAGTAFLLLCFELHDPPGTGIFSRSLPNGDLQVGVLTSDHVPPGLTDVFGPWFGPLLAGIVLVVVLGVRALLGRVLRDDSPRPPRP